MARRPNNYRLATHSEQMEAMRSRKISEITKEVEQNSFAPESPGMCIGDACNNYGRYACTKSRKGTKCDALF